jgi:hypothetical protein
MTTSARKRQDEVGAVVLISDAESSFEVETAAGFTRYELAAMGESDFSVKSFMFTMRVPSTTAGASPDATTASDGARAIDETSAAPTGFVFDTMTIALIAAAGALCVIGVIALIVCLARRKKSTNDDRKRESPSGDHFSVQMDEMRPALVASDVVAGAHAVTQRHAAEQSIAQNSMSSDNYHVLAAAVPNSAIGKLDPYKCCRCPTRTRRSRRRRIQWCGRTRPCRRRAPRTLAAVAASTSRCRSLPPASWARRRHRTRRSALRQRHRARSARRHRHSRRSASLPLATKRLGDSSRTAVVRVGGLSRTWRPQQTGNAGGLPPPPPVRTTSTQELSQQYNNIPI